MYQRYPFFMGHGFAGWWGASVAYGWAMTSGRSVRTDRARETFLSELAATCNVTASAKVAGMSRVAAYAWRADDAEFAAAWKSAIDEATDALEAEARRRAIEGVPEPVFYEGKVCGHKQRYSDRMLEILLKGHRPERFVETRKHELTGAEGGPIVTIDVGTHGPQSASGRCAWLADVKKAVEEAEAQAGQSETEDGDGG